MPAYSVASAGSIPALSHMMNGKKDAAWSVKQFLNLSADEWFIDHAGRRVHKISDVDVSLGIGYNNVMPIRDYVVAVMNGDTYGKYLVPGIGAL